MTYEPGDILLMPFPYSNLSAVKKRPVLVISSRAYNSAGDDIVICGITSNPRPAPYSVAFDNPDLASGSIPVPSRIKADKIFALEKTNVIKKFAHLSEQKLNETKEQMILLFNF
jgi:mRNA interferase MazF